MAWRILAALGGVLMLIGALGLGLFMVLATLEPPQLQWLFRSQYVGMVLGTFTGSLLLGAVLFVAALLTWAGSGERIRHTRHR